MRYQALATDYDGTLAADGQVADATWAAIQRLRDSGGKIVLVTGRELSELRRICPHLERFDRIVAENGGLLYRPATHEEQALAPPPTEQFVHALRQRKVAPLSVGRTIVATWRDQATVVLETIRDLGLEMHVIFNKDAVMVLPIGINKATGLTAALNEMGLSPHNVAGIGDAENDRAFLDLCGYSVAVSNALPMLKQHVDLVTSGDHGRGVIELIDKLLIEDLSHPAGHL